MANCKFNIWCIATLYIMQIFVLTFYNILLVFFYLGQMRYASSDRSSTEQSNKSLCQKAIEPRSLWPDVSRFSEESKTPR